MNEVDPAKAQRAPAKQEDLGYGQEDHEQRGLLMLACSEIGKILDEKLDKKLSTLKEDLAMKTCIESLRETIIEQNTKIETLEAKIVLLESYIKCIERNEELTKRHEDALESNEDRIEQLELKADNMEQYQRARRKNLLAFACLFTVYACLFMFCACLFTFFLGANHKAPTFHVTLW